MHNFLVKKKNSKKPFIIGGVIFLGLIMGMGSFFFYEKDGGENIDKNKSSSESFSEGNFEETITLLENSQEEKNIDTMMKLAVSYYNKKEYENSLKNYEKILELEEQNFTAHNGMANVYRDTKEYEKAEKSYRRAIEINIKYALAYSNLALMFIDIGKKDEAKNIIKEGRSQIPDSMELKNIENFIGGGE